MRAGDERPPGSEADRTRTYAVLGMVLGTAVAFALGLVLWMVTGQPLYLLVGGMGTGVGLLLGAGIDATQRDGEPPDEEPRPQGNADDADST